MRATVLAFAAVIAIGGAGVSAAAAPIAGPPAARSAAIVPVAGGCGIGFHRRTVRGPYGGLRTTCVPNGPGYGAYGGYRRCPPGLVWRRWRGPYGHWHARCVAM